MMEWPEGGDNQRKILGAGKTPVGLRPPSVLPAPRIKKSIQNSSGILIVANAEGYLSPNTRPRSITKCCVGIVIRDAFPTEFFGIRFRLTCDYSCNTTRGVLVMTQNGVLGEQADPDF